MLASGSQETIALHTNDGTTGYRFHKLEIIPQSPGEDTVEGIVKVYGVPQTTVDGVINFNDQTLLAVGYVSTTSSGNSVYFDNIIFDNITFNQDIYVTSIDLSNEIPINYQIQLEQMNLALDEATVATLKDIRNTGSQ